MHYPAKIDLHMHSRISDGTDTPAEILTCVRNAGLELFSVTDHDAVKAGRILPELLRPGDPAFIAGVEFSCKDELGQYHILGYGFDPDATPVQKVVQLGHSYRMKKLRARLDYLDHTFGFSFSEEDLMNLYTMDNPGKPHIGNLMVQYGYARSKEQAIEEFINGKSFRDEYVRPEQAITGIRGGGGIPVLAHPSYGSGDEIILGDDMDARLRRLMDFGLQGVEAFYSGFNKKLSDELLMFAERYGLYVTAGSDYHGGNKSVELGDTGLPGLPAPDDYPDGLRRFLDRIFSR